MVRLVQTNIDINLLTFINLKSQLHIKLLYKKYISY